MLMVSLEEFFKKVDFEKKAKEHEKFSSRQRINIGEMDLDARKPVFGVYEQQRHRPACASPQSDQHICYLLIAKYHI